MLRDHDDDPKSLNCHESVFTSVVYRRQVSKQRNNPPGSAARSSFDANPEAWVVRGDVRRVVTEYGPPRSCAGRFLAN